MGEPNEQLERVLAAWSATPGINAPNPGASDADLDVAEQRLGRQLPAAAAALYRELDGGSMLEGNLQLFPLLSDSGKLAVTTASRLMRSWEWPIPDELVLFGGDGADDNYGLWLPATDQSRPVVVNVGAIFEERSFAIVGDDLAGFLLGHTAFYVLSVLDDEDAAAAVELLGVPEELRVLEGSDDDYDALLRWANPGLPDPRRGLAADEVAAYAGRTA